MKMLNKNFPKSNLNIRLRKWYSFKQMANNMIKDDKLRKAVLKYCDQQINLCWRRSNSNMDGYEWDD